jgi:uncharacterized protein (TIRG00374 family)
LPKVIKQISNNKPLIIVLKFLLALLIFWVLIKIGFIQLYLIGKLFKNPVIILSLVSLMVSTLIICTYRWKILLFTQGIEIPFKKLIKIIYISTYFGFFLPGQIGSDALRILIGTNSLKNKRLIFGISVFVDRFVGASGLIFLGVLASILILWGKLSADIKLYMLFFTIFIFSGVALFILIYNKMIKNKIVFDNKQGLKTSNFIFRFTNKIAVSLEMYANYPYKLLICFLISIIAHLNNLLILYIIAYCMELRNYNIINYALAGTISFIVNFIPITPGGLGLGEAAFNQIFILLAENAQQTAHGTVVLAFRAVSIMLFSFAVFLNIKTKEECQEERIA